MLHPWIGLIFAVGVLQMYRMWASQMHVTQEDKDWFAAVGHYIQNEDDKMPPAGRYNAGQKSLFWGFFVCMILLLLSAIGLFMIHVYMGVFAERGVFGSVIRGEVTLAFAKRCHPRWYEEITGQPTTPRK